MFYVISREDCSWCDKAIEALNSRGEAVRVSLYTEHPMIGKLMGKAGLKTVPQIWYDNQYIGGCTELFSYLDKG